MSFETNHNEISKIIKKGGVVLMQVDTIFGLICDGLNTDAIKKIELIKKRNKPSFGFFVKNLNVAKKYAKLNTIQEQCFNKVFPGYFTLILEASNEAINYIYDKALGEKIINNNKIKTIGLRVPKNDFCLKILENFNTPLLATSANISGKTTATTFKDIDEHILKAVDCIYYNDNEKIAGLSSTIIDISDIQCCNIIRNGSGDINILQNIININKNT